MMKVIPTIIATLCLAYSALGDVHEERKNYGQDRLKQLRKQAEEKPVFQDIGTFKDGPEKDAPEIILSIKVVKVCKKIEPCKPMVWRHIESGKLVQYEIHDCRCDKAERIAAAKEKQKARHIEWLKNQNKLKKENKRWQKKRNQRLREVGLQMQIERIKYNHYGRYRAHGYCGQRCCRRYGVYRYGGG